MNEEQFLSIMLVWRQSLASANPGLVAAVRDEWDRWLAEQRAQPPNASRPQLIVVANLSCSEDLTAHVGLAQLLAMQNVRCSVILSFPTAPMMRIAQAQARREAWHGLVQIVASSQCRQLLKDLPADAPLALFSGPAILDPQAVREIFMIRHPWKVLPQRKRDGTPYRTFLAGSGFVGRAGDYFEWEATPSEEETGPVDFHQLVSEPAALGLSSAPRAAIRWNSWPEADSVLETADANGSGVDLPSIEGGDELIIRMDREPLPSAVIERRSARLCAPDEPLNIKVPASLLTTMPKIVRLESHKADGRVIGTNLVVRIPPWQLQPWMISSYLNRGGGGNPVIRAFAEGVGCRLAYAEDEPETLSDIPVVWGVLRDSARIISQAQAQWLYFFYIDHAYFNRGHGKSYRITRNRYEAGPVRKCPSDRLTKLGIEIEPWTRSGREIIVCPPTEYFVEAHQCADWLETTLEALRQGTDRPIIVREKPQPGETAVPLKTALRSAHALVTHSSNVAIEAACLGTPVFVNEASAAAPIGETDVSKIETPVYPDREPWLRHLAYNQFSLDEIRRGDAWRLLLELEEREFV
jgi:hypothetical protein